MNETQHQKMSNQNETLHLYTLNKLRFVPSRLVLVLRYSETKEANQLQEPGPPNFKPWARGPFGLIIFLARGSTVIIANNC